MNSDNNFSTFSLINGDKQAAADSDVVIAMAVYKGDRLDWLQQAVDSMLQQTYEKFIFYIVIDGFLPDDCFTYLKDTALHDTRILLYQSNLNIGLGDCLNFIIDSCATIKPKYLLRMDADDISVNDRLEKQLAFMQANQDIAVLGTGLNEIDENGNAIGSRKVPSSHDQIVKLLPRRCSLNHPTVMLRYSVLQSGYRYVSGTNITEDYFLWGELAKDGFKFWNLVEKLLKFRRVDAFYRRRGVKRSFSEFKARFYTMKKLKKFSVFNIVYAVFVLILRIMPSSIVKLAYKLDRLIMDKIIKH